MRRRARAAEPASGLTVYANAFLILMVPHAVVTVSLATAVLPRLSARAADGDLAGLARTVGSDAAHVLAVIIPFAALLPVIATDLANGFFGYGAGRRSYALYDPALTVFGPALVFFTVHYLVLRGFYALERNRTAFYVQCVIGAVNITAAIALVSATDPRATAAALAGAYLIAYAVGSIAVVRRAASLGRQPRHLGAACASWSGCCWPRPSPPRRRT